MLLAEDHLWKWWSSTNSIGECISFPLLLYFSENLQGSIIISCFDCANLAWCTFRNRISKNRAEKKINFDGIIWLKSRVRSVICFVYRRYAPSFWFMRFYPETGIHFLWHTTQNAELPLSVLWSKFPFPRPVCESLVRHYSWFRHKCFPRVVITELNHKIVR